MPQVVLTSIDLSKNELQNARAHVLGADPGTPSAGQFWYRSDTGLLTFQNASVAIRLGRLDQITAPTAAVSMNSQLVTNVLTPSAGTDAANKAYVDGIVGGGIAWKQPVRVATTVNGALATAFANTQVVDGITLATGDRILIKDQTTGAENGIYTVNATGAPTRATDSDSAAKLNAAAAFVTLGTVNADSAWTMTTDAVTLNTTALVFVQFSGLGQIAAGAGLTKTGNTLDVIGVANRITVAADSVDIASTYAGQASIVTLGTVATGVWNGSVVTTPFGGTGVASPTANGILVGQGAGVMTVVTGAQFTVLRAGAAGAPAFGAVNLDQAVAVTGTLPIGNGGGYTSAATAKTALGFPTKFTSTVGDGAAVAYVLTHNLNTRDVQVSVYRTASPWDVVIVDVEMTTVNTVTLRFAVAPAAAAFSAVIIG